VSGAQLWTRDLKTTSTGTELYWENDNIPVISAGKAAIVGAGRLLVLDLATRTQLWSVPGDFSGVSAMAGGLVYAILGPEVKVFDAATGTLAGTFRGMGDVPLIHQPLLTADTLIVSNGVRTFIFDRATFVKRQTLESGGALSYAAGTLYVVSRYLPSTLTTYHVAASEPDPAPDPLPPPQPPQPRPNPDRTLGPATAKWLDSARVGGIAYFLFNQPAKIERYELASGTWLAPISLPDAPKAFALSPDEIFVSFAKSLSKFSLDGATETPLSNLGVEPESLFWLDGRVYVLGDQGKNFTVIDATTGRFLQVKNFTNAQGGVSVAGTKHKFFSRNRGSGVLWDIFQTVINSDGTLGAQTDSPYRDGDYPTATRTFLFPGEARVIDDAGSIYSTDDLGYLGSLGGKFDDIDFVGGEPVVLRNRNTLVAYSAGLAETGRKSIAGSQLRIYVGGGFIHSFEFLAGRGVVETRTSLDDLGVDPSGPPIDPMQSAYTPDAIEFGAGDIVYLLSRQHQSIFRWSLAQRRYLESIPLDHVPQLMAYSPVPNRLYLSYASGRVTKIDLDAGLAESDFTNLAGRVLAMCVTDVGLFVVRKSGDYSWINETYAPSGAFVAASTFPVRGNEYTWSQAKRRLYYLENTSPAALFSQDIDTEGNLGLVYKTPFDANLYLKNPVRVAPDGSRIVLGDGSVFRTSDLTRISGLGALVDAAWLNGQLYILRASNVEAWGAGLRIDSAPIAGTPLRLLGVGDHLLAVTLVNGKPKFTLFDATLESGGPRPGGPVTQPNPARPLKATTTQWLDAARGADVAYFLFADPAKIERYDLANAQWLAPISLPSRPMAFTVGADGIYVAFAEEVSRFSFDGGTETLLFTANGPVQWLHENAGKLYYGTYDGAALYSDGYARCNELSVVSTSTGELLGRREFADYYLGGLSFAASRQRIFARHFREPLYNVFALPYPPSDFVAVGLAADGTFETEINSPNASNHPAAARTFLFADEAHLLDDGGSIYSTDDLAFWATIGSGHESRHAVNYGNPVELSPGNMDLAFIGDTAVVLRQGTLVAYSVGLFEVGRKTPTDAPLRIFPHGTDVISFAWQKGRGVAETRIPLAELTPVIFPLVRGAFFASLVAGPFEGVITFSLNAAGRATGSVVIDGVRLNFRAHFDNSGQATAFLPWRGGSLVLTLQLASDPEGKWAMFGALNNGTWSMTFRGTHAEREVPPGRYVFDLQGSGVGEGESRLGLAGCGTLRVNSRGLARVVGSLATGRAFSGTAWMEGNGSLALSARSSSGANAFIGTIQYADLAESDWTGYLQWIKPAADQSIQPGRRFATLLALTGAAYEPYPEALGAGAIRYVDVTISGGGMPFNIVNSPVLGARGSDAWGVDLIGLHLLVDKSGLVSGRFFRSGGKPWLDLRGAVNQKTRTARGYFRNGDHFGEMRIVPHQY
jgi:hypothetical protein